MAQAVRVQVPPRVPPLERGGKPHGSEVRLEPVALRVHSHGAMSEKSDAGDAVANRKARALALATDGGKKVAAGVRLMDFRKPTAAEVAHAAALAGKAGRALQRHGKIPA